jgi:hypothetical protein
MGRRGYPPEFRHRVLDLVEGQGRVARGRNPRAPPERSVTVSRHSAPAILIIRGFLTHAQWAK